MSSLREVKDRIASVRSTLKITSAMKLVASSKLRKAQRTIEALRPYEAVLARILSLLPGDSSAPASPSLGMTNESSPVISTGASPVISAGASSVISTGSSSVISTGSSSVISTGASSVISTGASSVISTGTQWSGEIPLPTIVVAISSNTSMCGAFNANVIKKVADTVAGLEGPVEVWAFGRKMADALRKSGRPAARDYTPLVTHPDSAEVADISRELRSLYDSGQIGRVILVYNHFVSTGRQTPVAETFLPFGPGDFSTPASPSLEMTKGALEMTKGALEMTRGTHEKTKGTLEMTRGTHEKTKGTFEKTKGAVSSVISTGAQRSGEIADDLYILEPSPEALAAAMIPQVLDLKLFAAILDSAAAEHAARMVAMQAATDNAEELLSQLTLEYNKGRQQKITSEILDIVGGSAEQ